MATRIRTTARSLSWLHKVPNFPRVKVFQLICHSEPRRGEESQKSLGNPSLACGVPSAAQNNSHTENTCAWSKADLDGNCIPITYICKNRAGNLINLLERFAGCAGRPRQF